MLTFLRKHQRIFFVVITAAIVVSFSFFGTYSTMGQQETAPDKEIVSGVKKPIMQQELASLCRLIESSPFDRTAPEKGGMPNFFNDGVIEKDFLSTGLGVLLGKRYFEDLKPDLDLRIKKIHSFRPYVHPRAQQISAEAIWGRFSPQLLERYKQLKGKSEQATTETFALMSQLYVDQAQLPSDTLKQILVMQQNQFGAQPDPVLANSDLALFGFKSMEDWFGPRFISLVGQFIINASQVAEEKGYQVSLEEVRADLYQNIAQGYSQVSRDGQISPEEAGQYFQYKMRSLGLDETTLLSSWKKVILFRRLFDEGSGSILLDPLAYQQFNQFAKESAQISLYQLPSHLQFSDFRSMLKFQLYIESIATDPSRLRTDLRLPAQTASLQQLEVKVPELVVRECEIEWSSVSKEELSHSISVKETWDWEAADPHWEEIRKNFPDLSLEQADSKQLRLAALDKLDEKGRFKVDQFARSKMIDEQPGKIALSLESATAKTSTVGLKARGSSFPFPGLKENTELVALLENASLKEQAKNSASERLSCYCPDGQQYYRIHVLRRDAAKKVLTFAESSKDGTLERLLDKRLEEAYSEVRRKDAHPFQLANGQWKPFKEVKDQIGKHLYSDLLASIEGQYRSQYGFLPGKEGELPLSFYSNARMVPHMKEALSHLQDKPDDPTWVKTEESLDALSSQWLLAKEERTMERCTQVPFAKEEMFTLNAHQWSSVNMGEKGAVAFYLLNEKSPLSQPPLKSVEQGHQILSFDARRDMMQHMLEKIHQKKAIDLSFIAAREP